MEIRVYVEGGESLKLHLQEFSDDFVKKITDNSMEWLEISCADGKVLVQKKAITYIKILKNGE